MYNNSIAVSNNHKTKDVSISREHLLQEKKYYYAAEKYVQMCTMGVVQNFFFLNQKNNKHSIVWTFQALVMDEHIADNQKMAQKPSNGVPFFFCFFSSLCMRGVPVLLVACLH